MGNRDGIFSWLSCEDTECGGCVLAAVTCPSATRSQGTRSPSFQFSACGHRVLVKRFPQRPPRCAWDETLQFPCSAFPSRQGEPVQPPEAAESGGNAAKCWQQTHCNPHLLPGPAAGRWLRWLDQSQAVCGGCFHGNTKGKLGCAFRMLAFGSERGRACGFPSVLELCARRDQGGTECFNTHPNKMGAS